MAEKLVIATAPTTRRCPRRAPVMEAGVPVEGVAFQSFRASSSFAWLASIRCWFATIVRWFANISSVDISVSSSRLIKRFEWPSGLIIAAGVSRIIFNSFLKRCFPSRQSGIHTLVGEAYQPKGVEVGAAGCVILLLSAVRVVVDRRMSTQIGPISPIGGYRTDKSYWTYRTSY